MIVKIVKTVGEVEYGTGQYVQAEGEGAPELQSASEIFQAESVSRDGATGKSLAFTFLDHEMAQVFRELSRALERSNQRADAVHAALNQARRYHQRLRASVERMSLFERVRFVVTGRITMKETACD
jgi:uncharacterized protein YkwD